MAFPSGGDLWLLAAQPAACGESAWGSPKLCRSIWKLSFWGGSGTGAHFPQVTKTMIEIWPSSPPHCNVDPQLISVHFPSPQKTGHLPHTTRPGPRLLLPPDISGGFVLIEPHALWTALAGCFVNRAGDTALASEARFSLQEKACRALDSRCAGKSATAAPHGPHPFQE